MKFISSIIKENDKSISNKALLAKFDAALYAADFVGLINSDLGLSRIQCYLKVLHTYNALESIERLHDRVVKLNSLRSTYNSKPRGFDFLIAEIETAFLSVCLDAGMGTAQLKALSYSFNYNDLEENDLLDLRSR